MTDISKKEISSSTTPGVKLVNPKEYIESITELKFRHFDRYCESKKDGNNYYRTANDMINLEYVNYSMKESSFNSNIDKKTHQYTIIKCEVLEWNGISFAGSLKFKNENGEIKTYNNIISEILLPFYNGDKKDDVDLEFAASLFNFPHDKFETIEDSLSVVNGIQITKKVIEISGENCRFIYATSHQDNSDLFSRIILVGNDKLKYTSTFSNGHRNDEFSINKDTDYSHLLLDVASFSIAEEKFGSIVGSISFDNIFDKKKSMPINYYIYNQSRILDINNALVSTRYNIESESIDSITECCLVDTDKDSLVRGPYGLLFKIKDIPNFF